ncbi:hypothetical protein PIB30_003217 [Stylosanthes scabra]|uniref:Uncharacterized protein n=1 Tax=Stylosanthes scabra TaxID=79078 RepID=A0ABU6Q360_9FABA|nr:hypothetical protein [Stylosanthes scabra]
MSSCPSSFPTSPSSKNVVVLASVPLSIAAPLPPPHHLQRCHCRCYSSSDDKMPSHMFTPSLHPQLPPLPQLVHQHPSPLPHAYLQLLPPSNVYDVIIANPDTSSPLSTSSSTSK